MIDILGGFPDGVVAFAAKGKITRSDYANILVPKSRRRLRATKKFDVTTSLGRSFRDGVGNACQFWIPNGEQSGLPTHTAMTEIALVLMRLDHVVGCIVNPNHGMMHAAGFRSAQ